MPLSKRVADFVVVGGGTAGCLLANRLSCSGKHSVILIEAGPTGRNWPLRMAIDVPAGYLYAMRSPKTDWQFSTTAQPGLGGRSIHYPRGKVLGGCSAVNGMVYIRGQARDYDGWDESMQPTSPSTNWKNSGYFHSAARWNWEAVLPYFMRHEKFIGTAGTGVEVNNFHGTTGELRVETVRTKWAVLEAWADAAKEFGIPASQDFNTGDNRGVGYFHVNQREGVRWSSASAFLSAEVLARPNLEVLHSTRVDRLLTEPSGCFSASGHRSPSAIAVGVLCEDGQEIRADREVILSAGAIMSPYLLLRSGIGPHSHLAEHGINTVVDVPGVGDNLSDHLQVRPVFKVSAQTLNSVSRSPGGLLAIAMEYFLRRSGPLAAAPSILGCFTSSIPGGPVDLQFHIQPLSLDSFGSPLHEFDAFTASVCNLNPSSRGQVCLSGPLLSDPPLINPRYLSTEHDLKVAVRAIGIARAIAKQSPLAALGTTEYYPGVEHCSVVELHKMAGLYSSSIFHPTGTCKMGPSHDSRAVVDSQLQMHDVEKLRIADASIFPTIPSGNTNAPTLMVAERAAEWVLDKTPT